MLNRLGIFVQAVLVQKVILMLNYQKRTLESFNLLKSQAGSVRYKPTRAVCHLGWKEGN